VPGLAFAVSTAALPLLQRRDPAIACAVLQTLKIALPLVCEPLVDASAVSSAAGVSDVDLGRLQHLLHRVEQVLNFFPAGTPCLDPAATAQPAAACFSPLAAAERLARGSSSSASGGSGSADVADGEDAGLVAVSAAAFDAALVRVVVEVLHAAPAALFQSGARSRAASPALDVGPRTMALLKELCCRWHWVAPAVAGNSTNSSSGGGGVLSPAAVLAMQQRLRAADPPAFAALGRAGAIVEQAVRVSHTFPVKPAGARAVATSTSTRLAGLHLDDQLAAMAALAPLLDAHRGHGVDGTAPPLEALFAPFSLPRAVPVLLILAAGRDAHHRSSPRPSAAAAAEAAAAGLRVAVGVWVRVFSRGSDAVKCAALEGVAALLLHAARLPADTGRLGSERLLSAALAAPAAGAAAGSAEATVRRLLGDLLPSEQSTHLLLPAWAAAIAGAASGALRGGPVTVAVPAVGAAVVGALCTPAVVQALLLYGVLRADTAAAEPPAPSAVRALALALLDALLGRARAAWDSPAAAEGALAAWAPLLPLLKVSVVPLYLVAHRAPHLIFTTPAPLLTCSCRWWSGARRSSATHPLLAPPGRACRAPSRPSCSTWRRTARAWPSTRRRPPGRVSATRARRTAAPSRSACSAATRPCAPAARCGAATRCPGWRRPPRPSCPSAGCSAGTPRTSPRRTRRCAAWTRSPPTTRTSRCRRWRRWRPRARRPRRWRRRPRRRRRWRTTPRAA